jgi:starch synthase (maltosyl-transferring)
MADRQQRTAADARAATDRAVPVLERAGPEAAGLTEALARRVIIERVHPSVDGGRFPIKRTAGETVDVAASIFADGHDVLAAVLRYRTTGSSASDE